MKIKIKKGMHSGKFYQIDIEDLPKIKEHKWHMNDQGYMLSNIRDGNGHRMLIMHRFLLDVPKGILIDHINNDRADNRKSNLRPCSRSHNALNRRKNKNGSTKYKGVTIEKSTGHFIAQIQSNKVHKYIGYFRKAIDAARAYDEEARKLHGEFALTNFKIIQLRQEYSRTLQQERNSTFKPQV